MSKVKNKKKILIVDDSEIDRSIIKNIIEKDFEIYEANNGFKALEFINAGKPQMDALLLDISMPLMDGFQMLRILNENSTARFIVTMITSEATLSNVVKAKELGVKGFIRKPFDEKIVKMKMRSLFEIDASDDEEEEAAEDPNLFDDDCAEATGDLIIRLVNIQKNFLASIGVDYSHYARMCEIMKILLEEYSSSSLHETLDTAHIEIIAAAAQFYDIGRMTVPDRIIADAYKHKDFESAEDREIYQNHTVSGAEIIRMNNNPKCSFFVDVCSDMCMHHHERFDGKGYPHMIGGEMLKDYTQMMILTEQFDKFYSHLSDFDDSRFAVVMNEFRRDRGKVSDEIIDLFEACKPKINALYKYKSQISSLN